MKKRKKNSANKITVFLDRDGVINKKAREGDYIKSKVELRLIKGAAKAIKLFNEKGYLTLVITNQGGIERGIISWDQFREVMDELNKRLSKKGAHLDGYYVCPDASDNSLFRKPNIGLFKLAKKEFPNINFKRSIIIGDSWRDMKAGKNIGAVTVFIGRSRKKEVECDYQARSLSKFVSEIDIEKLFSKANNFISWK